MRTVRPRGTSYVLTMSGAEPRPLDSTWGLHHHLYWVTDGPAWKALLRLPSQSPLGILCQKFPASPTQGLLARGSGFLLRPWYIQCQGIGSDCCTRHRGPSTPVGVPGWEPCKEGSHLVSKLQSWLWRLRLRQSWMNVLHCRACSWIIAWGWERHWNERETGKICSLIWALPRFCRFHMYSPDPKQNTFLLS